MKLIRFGESGNEKPGVLINGERKDLSSVFQDWDRQFFQNDGLKILKEYIKNPSVFPTIDDAERWGACVARPGKVICIGLNYSDHAAESGMAIPEEPIIFQKGSNTVVGPFDNILIPRNSVKTDWEVELGVVISKDARYLNSVEDAKDYIAGYCTSHDVSERAFQLERGGQWTKGKSCDNFNPLGPYLSTTDEVANVQNLKMSLSVNGVQKQTGNTSFMIFDVYHVIHHLSQFMTLEAGDIINTGTPPGVGLGFDPPQYLKEGDVVELEIEGLGSQKQSCINA
ncbi:2-keto-4-pentenoate hydratase/2-oxohepta-3-ene-1,7-dioic acid hydratase (catechol pathway) [Lutibacter agarilyticus]|uniref:2-keto-4-pentenoate hydratase/2-oxohepta-3-ene-1,7-dioic acid hydratase (Catechol pathway) n=1 Tax=Lutibacter agarilyticus TaxID=1109740 RepID=A0A238Z5T7_9FLAO|nr:fumarylacetoacetate hydrolase family protein [Lutibacter agarilyticus]SNR78174.1 2-keto-4-pentenoate hydratase/2-oxohepta-3-ene-1,7-dioic acid hydratase (catechol pathway) [Lutibacter agarilyticus]